MLINYIKTAYRNMMRNFSQTLINVLGLAVGMTCALLIFLWVQNQLSYDQTQENKDNIYRLEYSTWVVMPPYLGDLVTQLPEVEQMTRFYFWYHPTITYNENAYVVDDFALADSTVFEIFTFNFIHGTADNALDNPYSVVLTESMSTKLFGKDNPLGKEVMFDNKTPYTVTGVIEDVENFHIELNGIASLQDIKRMYGNNDFLEARNHNFLIYLLLNKNADYIDVSKKINKLSAAEIEDREGSAWDNLLLRAFNEIYFAKGLHHESGVKHGNMNLVLIFSAISILILLIACINFINITTAKANLREKEIAVRKIVGATRNKIAKQFIGETFFMVLVAHVISIVILEFILPQFNLITNESIHFSYVSPVFLSTIISTILLTTFLSGIYPSLYLSSLKPVLMLKGKSGKNSKGNLRKILMVIQFTISIFLIISTIIIVKQLNYVLNKDLGWNTDNMITLQLRGDNFSGELEDVMNNKDAFTNELLKNHNIKSTTYITQYPGDLTNTWTWDYEGNDYETKVFNADPEFIASLDLELIDGRNFSYDRSSDYTDSKMIINETSAKNMGLENPVGTFVNNDKTEIIGVVKDFNFNSLHNNIESMAIRWMPRSNRACIRISGNNIPETIKYIRELYNEFCPNYPFQYKFMDDQFAEQYANEIKQSKILIYFAFIAIFLAGLGLFGMSSFIAATRIKEIGIRKALGSSTSEIMILFSSNFIRWILIAFIIASPIAFYLVKKWLQQYPYKTEISWWIFAIALIITILIALITIGYQTIKSARTNPSDCLRYE
ncbi:MAG: ABC transporter permease [Bacteroidales bacterium]|nr:ABC transporter permease [Bacteroidales bacterium]